ncbi:Uncharacterised protein [Citrobacter koseri]|nr:Uncharacterised protein [Citrobacter koseri]STT23442.1 Uncharacterised protein [Citrobacter koseri]
MSNLTEAERKALQEAIRAYIRRRKEEEQSK